jgi:hypothetical protein
VGVRLWAYAVVASARISPFVKRVFGPFDALGREEALKVLESLVKV